MIRLRMAIIILGDCLVFMYYPYPRLVEHGMYLQPLN